MNIFEVQRNKQNRNFVIKNGNLELEVFADIIETCKEIPFVGSIIKLGTVAVNYMDWRYVTKLSKFLESSDKLSEDVVNKYISSLEQNDFERISVYLKHLLYTTEEDEKARIMGMVYKARLLNHINDEMMLRLCSIVNMSFVTDLRKLPLYVNKTNLSTLEAFNFINWGLIDNYVGGVWINEPSFELNEVGQTLHNILHSEGWYN